jgi:heme O synthase-like polyprenyltransferase
MMSLPLFPIWAVDFTGSALVILLAVRALAVAGRLKASDPENAHWLFLYSLTLALLIFALSRGIGHILQHI